MSSYKHTQSGYVIIVALGVMALLVTAFGFKSHPPMPPLIVAWILLVSAVLFWSLTIEISEDQLRWSFGPGVIRKSVPLPEIESVEPVRIHWWHGWGIHLTGYGWLYNVSGWEAVEVRLKSGKRFRLGTDEPERLVEAIRGATC